jgi:hypothetical protein
MGRNCLHGDKLSKINALNGSFRVEFLEIGGEIEKRTSKLNLS